jgi:phospholipase D1/2
MNARTEIDAQATEETRFFITAQEAYPAFEEAVLDAREELVVGFRIFDLSTRLHSERGRAIGRDWFDLLLHKVRDGVALRFVLSDFDPLVGEPLHALTWRSLRMLAAVRELAPEGAVVEATAALHPARLAIAARIALWPQVQMMLSQKTREILAMSAHSRALYLRDRPGLAEMVQNEAKRIRPKRLRLPRLAPVTHHQKVATIDGALVYCGGLDLNDRRYDDWEHDRPGPETWHDVQMLRRDDATAKAARAHILNFVPATHRAADPSDGEGRVLRTLSMRGHGKRLFSPRDLLRELEEEIIDGIESARRLIYLESQYLRDRHVTRALVRAARRNPKLELFVVLPGAPEDVAFEGSRRVDARYGEFLQARCIRKLRDAYGERVFIGSPVQPRASRSRGRDSLHGSPLIYVHAKVCLFDDERGVVSSANLNGRSMRWDTEFGLPLRDGDRIDALRHRLLDHWAAQDHSDAASPLLDPEHCVSAWRRQADENARRAPEARRGLLVPYLSGPARRFGHDLAIVPEEMV